MDTCAAIAVVIQVFGFGLVWAFVAGAAAAGRMEVPHLERITAAPGQQLFSASGTFTVPVGVTSICAVAVGRGYPSTNTGDV